MGILGKRVNSVTFKFLLGQPGNGGDNFERVRVEKTNLENTWEGDNGYIYLELVQFK